MRSPAVRRFGHSFIDLKKSGHGIGHAKGGQTSQNGTALRGTLDGTGRRTAVFHNFFLQ